MSFPALYEQLDSHCKSASTPMSMNGAWISDARTSARSCTFRVPWLRHSHAAGLRSMISASGISEADPRIAHTMAKVTESGKEGDAHLTLDEFAALIRPNLRMMCACSGDATVGAQLPCLRQDATLPGLVVVFCVGSACATAEVAPRVRQLRPQINAAKAKAV